MCYYPRHFPIAQYFLNFAASELLNRSQVIRVFDLWLHLTQWFKQQAIVATVEGVIPPLLNYKNVSKLLILCFLCSLPNNEYLVL